MVDGATWQTYRLGKKDAKRLAVKDRLVVVRTSSAARVFPGGAIDDAALAEELAAATVADPALGVRFQTARERLAARSFAPAAPPPAPAPAREWRPAPPEAAPARSLDWTPVAPARPAGPRASPACAACGTAVAPDDLFCTGCGTPVCGACGAESGKDTRFCSECGERRA